MNALRVQCFIHPSTKADLVGEAFDFYLAAKGPSQREIDNVVERIPKSVRRKGALEGRWGE